MRTPSIIELRVFEAALRTGSFSAAARELGVTQQAVSSRVRELERLLGFELVQRSPPGVTATESGRTLYELADQMLATSARLDTAISELRHEASKRDLRIGASQTVASHLLPEWLLELRLVRDQASQPLEEVELRTDNSERVIALLRAGKIDLGFIETPEQPRGLGHLTVATDRMIVAVDPKHSWATLASLPLETLATARLVTREVGSGTRESFCLLYTSRCV